jgi:hypothetical protein
MKRIYYSNWLNDSVLTLVKESFEYHHLLVTFDLGLYIRLNLQYGVLSTGLAQLVQSTME